MNPFEPHHISNNNADAWTWRNIENFRFGTQYRHSPTLSDFKASSPVSAGSEPNAWESPFWAWESSAAEWRQLARTDMWSPPLGNKSLSDNARAVYVISGQDLMVIWGFSYYHMVLRVTLAAVIFQCWRNQLAMTCSAAAVSCIPSSQAT